MVSGTRELTPDQVCAAAAVPLGQPLARQQLDAVARRATSLPQVSAAEVTRRVAAHRPRRRHRAACRCSRVAQPGGFLVVDKAGVVFAAKTDRCPPASSRSPRTRRTGRCSSSWARSCSACPTTCASQVASIAAATRDSITLKTTSGVTIVWGDASQSELKAQVAVALLDSGAEDSIDVSAPHAPAVR